MREALPRGDFPISPSDLDQRWVSTLCLTSKCFGVVRVIALFALLASTISPVDDFVQLDLSRRGSGGHPIVTAAKLARANLTRADGTAASVVFGAYADPVLYSAGHAAPGILHARLSSPVFGYAHTGRAPPLLTYR